MFILLQSWEKVFMNVFHVNLKLNIQRFNEISRPLLARTSEFRYIFKLQNYFSKIIIWLTFKRKTG